MEYWILIILLLLSGMFSSTEIAYLTANRIKIEIRSRKNNYSSKVANYFIKHPSAFFSTILISNNIVNISFASIFSIIAVETFGLSDVYVLIISTILLLIIGELIPKYLASESADKVLAIFIIPIRFISFLLYPAVSLFSFLSSSIVNKESSKSENILHLFDRNDINELIEESAEAGVVDEVQSNILRNLIDFGNQKVYEAMKPRTEIVGVEISSDIEMVYKTFIESGYSKLIVYEETLDDIKGVIIAYDLFKRPKNIKEILRPIIFVPETKKSLDMLNMFLEKHVSIAVVVDEFGGTAGIVTVEDILEEVLGEINDEFDLNEDFLYKQIDNKTFVISGKAEVDLLNQKFDLGIPEGDYETIAGYIINNLNRIPNKGEIIKIGNFSIQILNSDLKKIILIKLIIENTELEDN
jgi:CBS domain containing-hemolysin-like protein